MAKLSFPLRREKNLRRRRIGLATIGLLLPIVAPLGAFQFSSYRQNTATMRAQFPASPPLTQQDRLLVIVPHCDDETLGAGGTIATARKRGIPVRVVFMTNGDGSLATQIVEDAQQPRQIFSRRKSFLRMAKMRQGEARAALNKLGVPDEEIVFLGYPDGGTRAMWEQNWSPSTPYLSKYTGTSSSPYDNSPTPGAVYCGHQALQDVTRVIEDWKPTLVLTTHPADSHSDHYAAYAYTRAALETLRLRAGQEASGIRLLTFLVHQGLWPVPHGYHPDEPLAPPAALQNTGTQWTYAPLSTEARTAKKDALECYVSQLATTPYYLRSFVRNNELFGAVPTLTEGDEDASWDETQAGAEALPPVMRDSLRDTPMQELWPAADIKNVTLASFASTPQRESHLTLRVTTARAASPRLHYRVVLHTISSRGAHPYRLDLFYEKSRWRAILRNTQQNGQSWPVPVKAAADGLDVRLPREILHLQGSQAATLLVTASSLASRTTLDRSSLGTLRLMPQTRLKSQS